jgi:hypothetical protein
VAITREEFQEWQSHPVTQTFIKRVKRDVEDMKMLAMSVAEEDLKGLQGRFAVAMNILNMEYEDIHD